MLKLSQMEVTSRGTYITREIMMVRRYAGVFFFSVLVVSGTHQALSGRRGWGCSIPIMSEGSCLFLSSARH